MEKTITFEDLTETITLARQGNEDAIIQYAEAILHYSNLVCSDDYLQGHINQYAFAMLEDLAEKGNEIAQGILDDYAFEDNEYRE